MTPPTPRAGGTLMDPKVVKRLKEDHRPNSIGGECWGCAGVWPCDASLLLADWERRGEALTTIRDSDNEGIYCGCKHTDESCCNEAGEFCVQCIAAAALGGDKA